MSVHEILEMIFQNKRIFFLCTLAGLAISMLVYQRADKWYDSRAELLVEDRQTGDPSIRGLGVTTTIAYRFNMVRARLLSIGNLVELLPKFQLRGYNAAALASMSAAQKRGYEEALAKDVYGSLQMYMRGDMIFIGCERRGEGASGEANRIVDVMTQEVQSRYIEVRETNLNDARALLENLLNKYRERLEESETFVKNFSEINMVDLTDDAGDLRRSLLNLDNDNAGSKAVVQRMLTLIRRQDDATIQLRKLMAQREAVAAQVSEEPEYVTSEVTTAQSSMERLLQEKLAQARAELAEVRLDRSEEHPLVQDKLNDVRRYEQELEKSHTPVVKEERRVVNQRLVELRTELADLDAQIAALGSEQTGLRDEIAALTGRIKLIPTKELRRSELIREMNIARSMYQDIRMRFENAELTHQLEIRDRQTRFQIVSPPSLNLAPIRPNRKFIYIMGTFLGVIMGILISFLREFTDTSFRSLEDASRFLDLPVLGVIPEVTRGGRRRTRVRSTSSAGGGTS